MSSFNPSLQALSFVAEQGTTYDNLLLNASYTYDTRNRTVFATRGNSQTLALNLSTPGSDLEFYKLKYRATKYLSVTEKITFALKGGVSYGDGYGKTTDLPFYERFYAGGISTVRGFDNNSLGPKALDSLGNITTDPKGGNLAVNARAELLFPVPFAEDVKGLRMSAFVDAGNVFEDKFDSAEMRYSTGLSATWISPLGPLTLSYAKPLNEEEGDEIQNFQFSIGASF